MRLLSLLVVAFIASACAAPAVNRFPPDVATAIREQPMRRMETQSLEIYYSEHRKAEALRIAERAEGCAAALKAKALIHNSFADQKLVIVIPDVPFNNAYVQPPVLGMEAVSVIPTSNTFDFASELGLPSDPSYVGCHEIVHYVQVLQVSGFWGFLNRWVGNVISPHIGLDFWFLEGLATYYETQLQPGVGRPAWPVWRGNFHAAFANKRVNGGDLSIFQRPFHWGQHYLVGSYFVAFIAEKYGEKALWKLIERQGDSIFFPYGVALRFKSATGKSLPSLVDEFADYVAKQYPPRAKPASQRKIRDAGTAARYAVAATGREALVVAAGDLNTRLQIYDAGKLYREVQLVDVVPPHTLVVAHPLMTTGLSFTADGKFLYFVGVDAGPTKQEARLLRYDVENDDLEVVVPAIGGTGGGVSRDGSHYYYSYSDGDKRHLAVLDLKTRKAQILRTAEARTYYDLPRPSPNGKRVASAVFNGRRFVIRVLDAKTGATQTELQFPDSVHDPNWIDDNRMTILAEHNSAFQVHLFDTRDGSLTRVTDAPYLAFQARPMGDTVRFLDRDGWKWTVDEVPLDLAQGPPQTYEETPSTEGDAMAPASQAVTILEDSEYSQTDNLFFPSLRIPMLTSPSSNVSLFGAQITGGDRLGYHRWVLSAQYDLVGAEFSGSVQYATALLAPFSLILTADRLAWNEAIDDGNNGFAAGDFHSEQSASLFAFRGFRNLGLAAGASGIDIQDPGNSAPEFRERRLAGPEMLIAYSALDGSAYGGVQRGFALSASAAYYDQELSSLDANLTDIGGSLTVAMPLPLSGRHSLLASFRGRRLYGFDRNSSFLVVGGGDELGELWKQSNEDEPEEVVLPSPEPERSFRESLRGYEDFAFSTDRVAIAELTYNYPIIIDYGFSHTAYILPSVFFSQIDLQLFGSGASTSFANFEDHRRLAAGASVTLDMKFWLLPLRWRYQLAQRFTDDEALVHYFSIGI